MGKRIICGCVVLGIVACLIGCQKSDNYELMKESKQQVLSENGKYEETITYIDGLEDEEIPQISINEKEEYFIVMPNARKIFKCFKGEN